MRDLQPVSVAGIEFDALIDSKEAYNADVPDYPVDTGFSVSDNVAINAMELTMTLYLTATPVTWLATHGSGESRINTICNQLLEAYTEREPLTVVTRDKTYENMVISTISIEKGQENVLAREIPITLKQVTVTSSAETDIPEKLAKSGATKSNAGTAGTVKVSGSSGSSSSGSSGSSDGGSSSDPVTQVISTVTNTLSGNSSSGSSSSGKSSGKGSSTAFSIISGLRGKS